MGFGWVLKNVIVFRRSSRRRQILGKDNGWSEDWSKHLIISSQQHDKIFMDKFEERILSICTRVTLPEPTASSPASSVADIDKNVESRDDALSDSEEPPEGYYAFVESPNATPPRVRPPPYRQVSSPCPDVDSTRPHVSANNLCGDLNRGLIPKNPMGQNPNGEPYPFELIRNQTLRFLSRTLPVLRADDTLPRVAHLPPAALPDLQHNRLEERSKRSVSEAKAESAGAEGAGGEGALRAEHRGAGDAPPAAREGRKFCDGGGV
ncbi:unnamed protein product [Arctia plantaginis]|uniref:Uncharacterized protein n=1 Tax=Arctia plantaginis TaxID=874455 RepID=A0A8S0YYR8_ARCPL|nr:unnamed protein product [Arctia plantaginis]